MIAGQTNNTGREASAITVRRILYLVLPVLVIVGALIAYKSSSALGVIGKVSATGIFTPRGNVIPQVGASDAGVLTRTLNYFLVIRPAWVLGIRVGVAVIRVVSPQCWWLC